MSVSSWFMEVARGFLPSDTFAEIHRRAIEKERERIETQRVAPTERPIASPATLALVAAHLANEPRPTKEEIKPHVQERIEERLSLEITQGDLKELLEFVRKGGPNISVVGQKMDLVQELAVNWRGKHFVVVWSKSRNKLITVIPKKKKKKQNVRVGRPRDGRISGQSLMDDEAS